MYTTDLASGGGVREKRMALQEETAKLEKADKVLSNAEMLNSEITSSPADTKVLFDYVPKNREEEKLIESVDSLAGENNLFVVNISVVDAKANVVNQEGAETLLSTLPTGSDAPDTVAVQKAMEERVRAERVSPKNMNVNVSVVGAYSEIKSFINKMYGLKRANQVSSLLLKKLDETDVNGEKTASNKLQADITFRFSYIKALEKIYNFDVDNVIFEAQRFDKSILDDIRRKSVDVANVELRQDGNTNPFTN
jgi:hypothetical protein